MDREEGEAAEDPPKGEVQEEEAKGPRHPAEVSPEAVRAVDRAGDRAADPGVLRGADRAVELASSFFLPTVFSFDPEFLFLSYR